MIKKVLVIRFSSIGDIVLTTPVLRALKTQLGAEVHVLTKEGYRGILTANPYVDQVLSIKRSVREIAPMIRAARYDAVVDLHHNLRSLQVRLLMPGVPAYTFRKLNLEKWLMVRFKANLLPKLHIVDRYFGAALPLGVHNDGKGLDYFIPEDQEVVLSQLADTFQVEGALRTKIEAGAYLAFVIGAAHATKRMPEEKIIEVCQKITAPIILLGGPAEQVSGARIVQASGAHVLNGCGMYQLDQSASIIRQAEKVITHDTGLMHIAAAFGKEIISVWGNTIPEFGMTPYYPKGVSKNSTVQLEDVSCRPCSKIGFDHCPQGHFRCMQDIDPEYIARLATKKSMSGTVE